MLTAVADKTTSDLVKKTGQEGNDHKPVRDSDAGAKSLAPELQSKKSIRKTASCMVFFISNYTWWLLAVRTPPAHWGRSLERLEKGAF